MKEIIEFTDHAAAQYKSRFSFFNLSNMQIPTTRHYFGMKHGKGPSDRAGANYKKFVRQAVLKGVHFENCADLGQYSVMNYLQQTITHQNKKRKQHSYAHTLRKSLHHPEILECNEKLPKLHALVGCRDWLHAVQNTGVVEWQDFDCCCPGCLTHTGKCSNEHITDEWKRHSLTSHTKKELKDLDLSHWMPSFVKIKERNVEKDPSADADVSSDESAYELLSSDDSDSSSNEDAQPLSPEEILLSSDEEKVSETAWQDKHDSDVSLVSDVMEFLQETSSDESDVDGDVPLNYKEGLKKYCSYR